jgi:hypothetical protein
MKDRDFLAGLENEGFVAYANLKLEDGMRYEACIVTRDNGSSRAMPTNRYLGTELDYLSKMIGSDQQIYVRKFEPIEKNVQI